MLRLIWKKELRRHQGDLIIPVQKYITVNLFCVLKKSSIETVDIFPVSKVQGKVSSDFIGEGMWKQISQFWHPQSRAFFVGSDI